MIDETNKKIINELKKNSRQSIREIAKKTDLRPSTVHLRIDKMQKDNIIEKFTLKLNNKKVGESFIIFILINSDKEINSSVFKNPHIKEIFGITGEHDLLMKCKFSNIDEFNDFILKFRKIPEVKQTRTMVATAVLKEEL